VRRPATVVLAATCSLALSLASGCSGETPPAAAPAAGTVGDSATTPEPPAAPIPKVPVAKVPVAKVPVAEAPFEFKASPQPEGDRAQVLSWRLQRRAFEGAPPTIPHPVDHRTRDCLACHSSGATVSGVPVPQISHAQYRACQQCHAEKAPAFFTANAGGPEPAGSDFAPAPIAKAQRFTPGGPPMVPHTSWMRERCASCHGGLAPKALRTSHPERQSCQQCHVSEAGADQWAAGPPGPATR
jgi:cytochrome c-type protein NapB